MRCALSALSWDCRSISFDTQASKDVALGIRRIVSPVPSTAPIMIAMANTTAHSREERCAKGNVAMRENVSTDLPRAVKFRKLGDPERDHSAL